MNAASINRLRERRMHLGSWLSIGSPVIAELAGECGFNWVLIDLEHGCGGEAALLGQLQSLRGTGTAAIVRVGAPQSDLIGRVLDWGADGIMVPHVSNAEEAEACVRAMRYPPEGGRGVSRSVRAYGYGLRPPVAGVVVQPLLFAQIESAEAVENARAIAAVEGVDVLFVGPADLRYDLEAHPAQGARDFDACLREVATAANVAGKQCGILLRNAGEVAKVRGLGFTQIAIDSDLGILRAGYQKIVAGAADRS